jgi:hypothetical protein
MADKKKSTELIKESILKMTNDWSPAVWEVTSRYADVHNVSFIAATCYYVRLAKQQKDEMEKYGEIKSFV